jgi:hypothetical protein
MNSIEGNNTQIGAKVLKKMFLRMNDGSDEHS